MAKEKKKEKISLTKYDPVESPEDVIAADNDVERREAFKKTYENIAKIIPNYLAEQRRKRNNNNGSTGGKAFSHIIVTPEKVTVQNNEEKGEESKEVKEEKERED